MADIIFTCPYCSKSLAIDERGAGLRVKCVDCRKMVTVPPVQQPEVLGKCPTCGMTLMAGIEHRCAEKPAPSHSLLAYSYAPRTRSSPDVPKTSSSENDSWNTFLVFYLLAAFICFVAGIAIAAGGPESADVGAWLMLVGAFVMPLILCAIATYRKFRTGELAREWEQSKRTPKQHTPVWVNIVIAIVVTGPVWWPWLDKMARTGRITPEQPSAVAQEQRNTKANDAHSLFGLPVISREIAGLHLGENILTAIDRYVRETGQTNAFFMSTSFPSDFTHEKFFPKSIPNAEAWVGVSYGCIESIEVKFPASEGDAVVASLSQTYGSDGLRAGGYSKIVSMNGQEISVVTSSRYEDNSGGSEVQRAYLLASHTYAQVGLFTVTYSYTRLMKYSETKHDDQEQKEKIKEEAERQRQSREDRQHYQGNL